MLKGSLLMPADNDSAFLLDKHKRGLQNLDRMARYRDEDTVDLVVVGAGAGGGVLAQRLARKGWRVVVLERGTFWDPDRDWVSDEKGAGQAGLYWTDNRIISGNDPIETKSDVSVRVSGVTLVASKSRARPRIIQKKASIGQVPRRSVPPMVAMVWTLASITLPVIVLTLPSITMRTA